MRSQLPALVTLSAALALPAGCATSGGIPRHLTDEQLRARYAAYAGPSIREFTWLGHFYSWEPLGKQDLVVYTTPSDAYLLKVWPPCDMRWDIYRIDISSTAGTVNAGLDYVTEFSPALGKLRCPISEIRRVDYRRMMADLRQKRQPGEAAPNPAPGGSSAQP